MATINFVFRMLRIDSRILLAQTILSLFRTLVFLILPLLILPKFRGVDGVWISMPAAEMLSILISVFYFRHLKGKYHYA